MVERIQELYREYAAEFQRQEEKRRAGAGMFGLTDGPRNYPCHERFARDLESLLKEAEKTAVPEQAEEILACVYFAPQARVSQAKEEPDLYFCGVFGVFDAKSGKRRGISHKLYSGIDRTCKGKH